MRARVSWADPGGIRHEWDIVYDPDDVEARHFLEGLQLHLRFRLESFDVAAADIAAEPD